MVPCSGLGANRLTTSYFFSYENIISQTLPIGLNQFVGID